MNESCPTCRQPISIAPDLAGQKIACPHCGQHIQLPPATTPSPYASPATRSPEAAATGPKTTSGLAIASLVLALVGLLIPFICHLASIVMGHISRSQIKKDPNLSGAGLALAGLIISYICIAIFPIAILAAIALPAFSIVNEKAKVTQEMSHLRQVAMGLKMCAIDEGGTFPGSLDELEPRYINNPDVFTTPLSSGPEKETFIYFPGLTDESPPDTIILASPVVLKGNRSVATVDGAAHHIPEHEYQRRTSGQP